MGMTCRIARDRLVDAYMAARGLWRISRDSEHDLLDESVHMFVLQDLLQWHVLTPTVIGSGRASAAHKMKALIWSMMLESSWEAAAQTLSGAHYTTDFGTESKLPCFLPFHLHYLVLVIINHYYIKFFLFCFILFLLNFPILKNFFNHFIFIIF